MNAVAFADPARESQAAYRAILEAMARPGAVMACGGSLAPPAPLSPAAAASILTLADFETPLWLAPSFQASEVRAYLAFHTGAPIAASPDKAAFALIDAEADSLELSRFTLGTPDYPDRSTTIVLQSRSLSDGARLHLAGPGVRGEAALSIDPLPQDFLAQWAANRAAFPQGVDLILAAGAKVAGLPRSIRILGGG